MSDKTLRYIIASVIALLLVFQIGTVIDGLFGMLWKMTAEGLSLFGRVARLAPFIIGFGAPIALLLIVYYELRKRIIDG